MTGRYLSGGLCYFRYSTDIYSLIILPMTQKKEVHIGFVQMACAADQTKNLEKAKNFILDAAHRGAEIICLQELFHMIYFCHEENFDHFGKAESRDAGTFRELSQLAKEHNIVLIIPYFEKRAGGIYHNSALVVDADGSVLGNYRKNHIPDDPGYYEKFYFTPGDTGYQVFKTRYATIGVLICWDQWFPEAARITSMMGADILFYPTAIGWEDHEDPESCKIQRDAWMCIQRSHAIANGIYVAAVNRVGREQLTRFWGSSFICDPSGSILTQADENKEEVITQTIELAAIDRQRTHWPFFRDRRVDTYHPIDKKWVD
jgi:N-carbamoylputrescine amidase